MRVVIHVLGISEDVATAKWLLIQEFGGMGLRWRVEMVEDSHLQRLVGICAGRIEYDGFDGADYVRWQVADKLVEACSGRGNVCVDETCFGYEEPRFRVFWQEQRQLQSDVVVSGAAADGVGCGHVACVEGCGNSR